MQCSLLGRCDGPLVHSPSLAASPQSTVPPDGSPAGERVAFRSLARPHGAATSAAYRGDDGCLCDACASARGSYAGLVVRMRYGRGRGFPWSSWSSGQCGMHETVECGRATELAAAVALLAPAIGIGRRLSSARFGLLPPLGTLCGFAAVASGYDRQPWLCAPLAALMPPMCIAPVSSSRVSSAWPSWPLVIVSVCGVAPTSRRVPAPAPLLLVIVRRRSSCASVPIECGPAFAPAPLEMGLSPIRRPSSIESARPSPSA